jgi:hypothetical protein
VTADQPNIDIGENFNVTSTANILTLFLLPLAATFFRRIVIAGCDGRPLDESDYFWKHDKSSQFNDKMAAIRAAHPGFFAIDYNEYYLEHCQTVAKWIDTAERAGKTVENMTPSYVPALRERYTDPLSRRGDVAEVVILDPDAKGHFGHFLAFDDKLEAACRAKGLEFSIFGRVDCADDVVDARRHFERVFTRHSWTIGNRPKGGPSREDLEAVEKELRKALKLRAEKGLSRRTLLYMYCGSLPMARIVRDVLADYENVCAVINLFWLSFMDYRAKSYKDEWVDFVRECLKDDRIALYVPTERLAGGRIRP